MGLFFNYDNSICNESATPVVFSFDPSISSLKELLIYELSQLSYYECKIRDLGENTEKLADEIINYITLIVVNLDFRREQLLNVIKSIYDEVEKNKEIYQEICKKKNAQCEIIMGEKLSFTTKKEGIEAVNFGEKQALIKNTVFSKMKKTLSDISLMLISNACLCITELENYKISAGNLKFEIPSLMKIINYDKLSDEELKNKIYDFAKINRKIMIKLNETITQKYGPIKETEVDLSIKKGKCILVSGHYYQNLENLLEAAKDEDINVYTHNDMLFAHSFSQFHKYKNLAGHYQRSINNLQLDFASFPGAVLVTKNSHPNLDVIRGRIFTPDNNPAYGICKVSENDFSPIIKAAKEEKGFKKNIKINEITVGYDIDSIKEKFSTIIGKLKKNLYKHLFIIGLINYNIPQNLYFNKFFEIVPDDCFVISFSYKRNKKNVLHIDSYYDLSLTYEIFKELSIYPKILKDKTTVFLTQCRLETISHCFNLKIAGVKNIYIGECCPNVVNPSVIDGMEKFFGIKQISDSPQKDIKNILKSSKQKRAD